MVYQRDTESEAVGEREQQVYRKQLLGHVWRSKDALLSLTEIFFLFFLYDLQASKKVLPPAW